MKKTRIKYHGWIVIQHNEGFRDSFRAEWRDNEGVWQGSQVWYSPAPAIEFWEERVAGNYTLPVLLLPTPLGAYRVYTNEPK